MIARPAIILATLWTVAPTANPIDLASLAGAVAQVERITAVDVPTMLAVVSVETGGTFRPYLVSSAGACGLFQVIPKWSPLDCEQLKHPLGGTVGGLIAWTYWASRSGRYSTAELYNAGNRPGYAAAVYAREHERRRRRIAAVMGE